MKIPKYVQKKCGADEKRQEAENSADRKKIIAALQGLAECLHERKEAENRDDEFDRTMRWPLEQEAHKTAVNTLRVYAGTLIVTFLGVAAAFIAGCFAFGQLHVMKGQLDESIAQQRPWLRVQVHLDPTRTIKFWNSPGKYPSRSINVPISLNIKNFGPSPAVRVIHMERTFPHPGNVNMKTLDPLQDALCATAENSSNGSDRTDSYTIFPGEEKQIYAGPGGDVPLNESSSMYIIEGCIDYTYSDKRHGKTAWRMMLGRIVSNSWTGIDFQIGKESMDGWGETTIARVEPTGLEFRETEDGANWVK